MPQPSTARTDWRRLNSVGGASRRERSALKSPVHQRRARGPCWTGRAAGRSRTEVGRWTLDPFSLLLYGLKAPLWSRSLARACASLADRVTRAMTSRCVAPISSCSTSRSINSHSTSRHIALSLFDNRFSLFGIAFRFFRRFSLAAVTPTLLLTLFLRFFRKPECTFYTRLPAWSLFPKIHFI